MMTIKTTIITMMIISSISLPLGHRQMDGAVEYPANKIALMNQAIAPAMPLEGPELISPVPEINPLAPMNNPEQVITINKDKTYEQCMAEAFEIVYKSVNRSLDQIPRQCDEQFQLQRMM